MRFTQTLIKTTKDAPKDATAKNAQLLIRAGYIDKLMAGVYSYLPLGLRVINKTADLLRKHMNKAGGVEILMPSLHPKQNYQTTDRWDTMDSLVRFTTHWTKTEYALGATHEEIVTPIAKQFVNSYKDLPKAIYQIQNKFRDEKRAKSGILRGREFLMKDMYSFHASQEDLDSFYVKMEQVYADLFAEAGLEGITYKTFASGGDFSKYSHEYQTKCDAGEDIVYLCKKCNIGVNSEIIEEQKTCPECDNADLEQIKSIEVGNIFKLKDKFSKPFEMFYVDESGKKQSIVMGCYGIGLGRLAGTVVEVLSDDKGIVWSDALAPFRVHLVGLNLEDADVKKAADDFYEKLNEASIEVLYDDRLGAKAGAKFADADLIGCPLRVTISKKTVEKGEYELKKRTEEEIVMNSLDSLGLLKL